MKIEGGRVYRNVAGEFKKAAGKSSPKGADEIQGRIAALNDIHDCVVMICQAYGNPQSSVNSLRGTPTAAWIKKFDKSMLVVRKDSFARIRYISQEICRILAFLDLTRFYGFLPSIQSIPFHRECQSVRQR